ncbi:MAG: BatA domain-containing protein [Phycisphaerales bacterium JB050]
MTFLNAGLLAAGLAAVSIPILIHLLMRQRRKPVRWAAMRFLMEAYRKQRRRLRLQQWILLATRCLIIAMLAFALGRPMLEAAGLIGSGTGRSVYLLIDNGVASSARENTAPALDRHKAAAREALASLGEGDRAGLITLGGPAEAIVVPASPDIAAVRRLVDAIEPTDSKTDLHAALDQLRSTIGAEADTTETVAIVISDFARGSADLSTPLPASLAEFSRVRVVATSPATSLPGNIQITSVDPLRSVVLASDDPEQSIDEQQQIRITLQRTGAAIRESQVTTVRLRVATPAEADDSSSVAAGLGMTTTVSWRPGQERATASVQINAQAIRAAISSSAGQTAVLIAEIDRDAIEADNTFRRPIALRDALRVGILAQRRFGRGPTVDQLEPADWFRIALEPQTGVPIETIDANPSAIDLPFLSNLDAAILTQPHLVTDDGWEALRSFVVSGGMLLITPPHEDMANLWTDRLTEQFGLEWRLAREPIARDENPMQLAGDDAESPLLSLINAELPRLARNITITRALRFEGETEGADRILDMRDPATGLNEPWLIAQRPQGTEGSSPVDRGLVVFLASAPDARWTNLPLMPLMVPLTQELIRQGVGRAAGSSSIIAGVAPPTPTGSTRLVRSSESISASGIAVGPNGIAQRAIARAGTYRAFDEVDRVRGVIAVNADTSGTDLSVQSESTVQAWLDEVTAGSDDADTSVSWVNADQLAGSLTRTDSGSPISLPLLIGALVLACAEAVMARLFSHAESDTSTRSIAAPQAGAA